MGSKSIEKQRNYYTVIRLDFDSYPGVIPLFPVKGLLGIKLQVETNGTVFHGQSYLPNEKHFHLEMKISLKSNRINDFKGNVDSPIQLFLGKIDIWKNLHICSFSKK